MPSMAIIATLSTEVMPRIGESMSSSSTGQAAFLASIVFSAAQAVVASPNEQARPSMTVPGCLYTSGKRALPSRAETWDQELPRFVARRRRC